MTANGTERQENTSAGKPPAEDDRKTVDREIARADRGGQQGGYHPENKEGARKATADNDLTTGHTTPGDGGDDNAKPKDRKAGP